MWSRKSVSLLLLLAAWACKRPSPTLTEEPIGLGDDQCLPQFEACAVNCIEDNGETDVDCGGTNPCPCADGEGCLVGDDCVSGVCEDGICQEPTCEDGVKNGDEPNADCGGFDCNSCGVGVDCHSGLDCESDVCGGNAGTCNGPTCLAPSCDDGVFNGDETDLDCGGSCS